METDTNKSWFVLVVHRDHVMKSSVISIMLHASAVLRKQRAPPRPQTAARYPAPLPPAAPTDLNALVQAVPCTSIHERGSALPPALRIDMTHKATRYGTAHPVRRRRLHMHICSHHARHRGNHSLPLASTYVCHAAIIGLPRFLFANNNYYTQATRARPWATRPNPLAANQTAFVHPRLLRPPSRPVASSPCTSAHARK